MAQPASQSGPNQPQGYYQQMAPQQMPAHRSVWRHHGIKQIISDEIHAGRLSEKEGSLLQQKIRQMHAEKRARRQSRENGAGASPPQQTQQPR
ncbi:MAG: hypothetical protein ACREHF_10905 [Rhizomicrobium sp.]